MSASPEIMLTLRIPAGLMHPMTPDAVQAWLDQQGTWSVDWNAARWRLDTTSQGFIVEAPLRVMMKRELA